MVVPNVYGYLKEVAYRLCMVLCVLFAAMLMKFSFLTKTKYYLYVSVIWDILGLILRPLWYSYDGNQ